MRFLDASFGELAVALGVSDEATAWSILRGSFTGSELKQALEEGFSGATKGYRGSGPGWFRFLLFTCVIEAQSFDAFGSNKFRDRVDIAKGVRLSNVFALPKLWELLRSWLSRAQTEGLPYRSLILPDPGTMNQIGYSVNITFPTWRDADRMTGLWGDGRGLVRSGPHAACRAVRRSMRTRAWSDGFNGAFLDFERKVAKRLTLIEDHPFWVQLGKLSPARTKSSPVDPTVDLHTDQDGQTYCTISPCTSPLATAFASRGLEVSSAITVGIGDLLSAIACDKEGTLPRWMHAAAERRFFVFNEELFGWRMARVPEGAYCRLLLDGGWAVKQEIAGTAHGAWVLSAPLPFGKARILHDARRGADRNETIGAVRLIEGLKTSSGYLGYGPVLPTVKACAGCEVDIRPSPDAEGRLAVHDIEQAVFPLTSSDVLRGRWTISVREQGNLVANLPLSLDDRADELDPSEFKSAPATLLYNGELDLAGEALAFDVHPLRNDTHPSDVAMTGLLESVYTKGRSGMSEGELVQLIAKFFPGNSVSPWDVLRLLGESGWMDSYTSTAWQARYWYLRRPSLVFDADSGIVVLDGAATLRTRRRFEMAIEACGGELFGGSPPNAIAVPRPTGRCTEIASVASDTGLAAAPPKTALLGARGLVPLAFSRHGGEMMEVASHYDWSTCRFEPGAGDVATAVTLERLVHPRRTVPECFRVASGANQSFFGSRTAAMMAAFRLEARPLFAFDDTTQRVTRRARTGYLPMEIARYLSARSCTNSEIDMSTGRGAYRYPCSKADLARLEDWLGHSLFGRIRPPGSDPLLTTVLARRIGFARAELLVGR